MDLLVRLNKEVRQTFVLVTHSEDVGGMTDRIVRMSDGVVVDDGSRGDDFSASADDNSESNS
jgi:ABC-type lipoprotein export system ATPase subunit